MPIIGRKMSASESKTKPWKKLANAEKEALINYLCQYINEQRQSLLKTVLSHRTRYITVVLEDIYQTQNASAVLRTAECLGLQELHVIEKRNQYQLNADVVQGASKWIEINRYNDRSHNNTEHCLQALKERGYQIMAMTLQQGSQDLEQAPIDNKMALCFGTEETGLSDRAHELADSYIQIPMTGFTQSFNLSVSAGISLYQLMNRLRQSDIEWQLEKEDKINLLIDWLIKSTPTGPKLMKNFINNLDRCS